MITWASEGIDISDSQRSPLPAARMRAEGISWVYVKASEGTTLYAKEFENHVETFYGEGFLVGAYNYWHPQADGGVIASAEAFCSRVYDLPAAQGLPPMCDAETRCGSEGCRAPNHKKTTGKEFVEKILQWLEKVTSELGRLPIVYLGPNFASTLVRDGADLTPLTKYPLLVAAYHARESQGTIAPWNNWSIWQWTDGGQKGPKQLTGGCAVDRNRSIFTVEQLAQMGQLAPDNTHVALPIPDMWNMVRSAVGGP